MKSGSILDASSDEYIRASPEVLGIPNLVETSLMKTNSSLAPGSDLAAAETICERSGVGELGWSQTNFISTLLSNGLSFLSIT